MDDFGPSKFLLLAKELGLAATAIGCIVWVLYKVAPVLLGYAERQMAIRFEERATLLSELDSARKEADQWREKYYRLEEHRLAEERRRLQEAQDRFDRGPEA